MADSPESPVRRLASRFDKPYHSPVPCQSSPSLPTPANGRKKIGKLPECNRGRHTQFVSGVRLFQTQLSPVEAPKRNPVNRRRSIAGASPFQVSPSKPSHSPLSKSFSQSLSPVQFSKVNLVAERAAKFGRQTATKRPSFIRKDPHNPFNDSMLWKSDSHFWDDSPPIPTSTGSSLDQVLQFESEDVVVNIEQGNGTLQCQDYERDTSTQTSMLKAENEEDSRASLISRDDSTMNSSVVKLPDDETIATMDESVLIKPSADPVPRSPTKVRNVVCRSSGSDRGDKTRRNIGEKKSKRKGKIKRNVKAKENASRSCSPEWEFGKRMSFEFPPINKTTTQAAIQIQRSARGWWQRLNYRIQLLAYKLENKQELTDSAVQQVWTHQEEKKDRYYHIVETKCDRKQAREWEKNEEVRQKSQELIIYLRRDNKKYRENIERMVDEACLMKEHKKGLDRAAMMIREKSQELRQHVERFSATRLQLDEVVAAYDRKKERLRHALVQARRYCDFENNCKIKYMKALGEIVSMIQEQCQDDELVDEVVGYLLKSDTST